MNYTYVLQNKIDNTLYIGQTNDLKKRIETHNKGKVKSTKNKIPWEIIYYEACQNREDAIKREKQLKTGFGRAYLKRRIANLNK